MKKIILASLIILLFASCSYARVRRQQRSLTDIAASALLAQVILGIATWCYRRHKKANDTCNEETVPKDKTTVSHEQPTAPPHEPPHTEQLEDTSSRQASAIKLVNLGLACIGRKTKHSNLYLTGMESKRQQAEYTFLRQVAERYRDAGARKVIARHFMLYKECCLYIIYSVVLKHEPELHRLVRAALTERMTDGLTAEAKAQRKEYMYAFSRAFYDEYQRTKSRHQTLSFMFWSVLCIKHPELVSASELPELMSISGLARVYRYTQETLEAAVK